MLVTPRLGRGASTWARTKCRVRFPENIDQSRVAVEAKERAQGPLDHALGGFLGGFYLARSAYQSSCGAPEWRRKPRAVWRSNEIRRSGEPLLSPARLPVPPLRRRCNVAGRSGRFLESRPARPASSASDRTAWIGDKRMPVRAVLSGVMPSCPCHRRVPRRTGIFFFCPGSPPGNLFPSAFPRASICNTELGTKFVSQPVRSL